MFPVHPARNLFSKYEIHDKLGSGRFGTVRRCTHRATDIDFACKRVAPFKEELRGAANEIDSLTLLHGVGHVTPLRDVFRDSEGALYMLSDLATGGDLVSRILNHGPLSECDAREIFRDIAAGVHECHERGILHRDIKPDNVLLFPRSPREPCLDNSESDSAWSFESSHSNTLFESSTAGSTVGSTCGSTAGSTRRHPADSSESTSDVSSAAPSSPSTSSASQSSSASSSLSSSSTANSGAQPRGVEPHLRRVENRRPSPTTRAKKPASGSGEARGCAFVAKLADFGGSTVLKSGQSATGYVGSMPYMAPEVAARKPYGFPADVWSMGVTLYVILSGRWPTISHARQSSRDWELPCWKSVSGRAKSLIRRMLSGDPQARPTVGRILQDAWLCGTSTFAVTRQTACIKGMEPGAPDGSRIPRESTSRSGRLTCNGLASHLLPRWLAA
ncbi:hypothetical protein CLOM_g13192 [Closterium sp. NIES-68]|nr:hypothetical protein CLOM_g13192 [Closterium sp. NIES-68]